jgi:hypothetical protein
MAVPLAAEQLFVTMQSKSQKFLFPSVITAPPPRQDTVLVCFEESVCPSVMVNPWMHPAAVPLARMHLTAFGPLPNESTRLESLVVSASPAITVSSAEPVDTIRILASVDLKAMRQRGIFALALYSVAPLLYTPGAT